MKVTPGYKHTEVGVIPRGWQVRCLKEISSQITDGDHLTPKRSREGYLLLSARNVRDGRIDLTDVDFVGPDEYKRMRLRCAPQFGDILISCSGHGLGRVSTVPEGLRCVLVRSAALVKIDGTVANSHFVHYWLRSKHAQKQIAIQLSRAAQPNLFINNIEQLLVPLPPTKAEQEAIAKALIDVDALIESLEQLLVKKRQLKQGVMQELLTGKKRLPGFSGTWDACHFSDLFSVLRNASNSRNELSDLGEIAYVHYGDIHTYPNGFLNPFAKQTYISREKVPTIPRLADGDLLMVDASEDTAAIGKAVEIVGLGGREAVAGLHTILLRPDKKKLADGFKGYLQFLPKVRAALVRFATGVSVYGITKSSVKAIEVTIPKAPEQIAIATILTDMDAEIDALEAKLAKARLIKQGMMQELLTGRIRLV